MAAMPVKFEVVGTYRSDTSVKYLKEGRVLRMTFATGNGDPDEDEAEVELDMTHSGARDLALAIIQAIGGTTESSVMYIMNHVLSAIDDLQDDIDSGYDPSNN